MYPDMHYPQSDNIREAFGKFICEVCVPSGQSNCNKSWIDVTLWLKKKKHLKLTQSNLLPTTTLGGRLMEENTKNSLDLCGMEGRMCYYDGIQILALSITGLAILFRM